MPFFTLNGVTIPIKSNAVQVKHNEHRLDRDRMFDGTMRVIRGGSAGIYGAGVYRQWDVNTGSLSESDANTLLAMVHGDTIPLALSGDIVGNIEVAVIPVPGTNNPLQVAGGFRRLVTFTLHETPTALPPDTSATPFLFLRAGTGMYSDDAGTVGAGDGDQIGRWVDAFGTGRYFTFFSSDIFRPRRQGDTARFSDVDGGIYGSALVMDAAGTALFNLFTAGEIMAAVRIDVYPPATDNNGGLWQLGNDGNGPSFYSKANSHLFGGFGQGTPLDLGVSPADLSAEYHVFGENTNPSAYQAWFDNVMIYTAPSPTLNFDVIHPVIGHQNAGSPGPHMIGNIKHLVIFSGVLTTTQRRSWYDFLRGALTDPPLP